MARQKMTTIGVVLEGTTGIMFDRYPGDNETQLEPEQKMYLTNKGELYLPHLNIISFLSATQTKSAPRLAYDIRKYKDIAMTLLGSVAITPEVILFRRNGKSIKFEGWNKNGITLHKAVARLAKGIPNPKERPLLAAPWSLEFDLTLTDNEHVNSDQLRNIFRLGGLMLGLGTFRGAFGKFKVKSWKIKEVVEI